jgi:hypothetical protein
MIKIIRIYGNHGKLMKGISTGLTIAGILGVLKIIMTITKATAVTGTVTKGVALAGALHVGAQVARHVPNEVLIPARVAAEANRVYNSSKDKRITQNAGYNPCAKNLSAPPDRAYRMRNCMKIDIVKFSDGVSLRL